MRRSRGQAADTQKHRAVACQSNRIFLSDGLGNFATIAAVNLVNLWICNAVRLGGNSSNIFSA